jgi:CubicO group peptidase (beta-lactamase class C family)
MHASYKDVTLEDLLAQRGGVPATIPAGILANAYPPGDPAALRDQAVRALLAAGPATAPGTFVESDASFLLAAAMVERATSVPWETLTETRIFAPLGMTSCTTVLRDLGAEPLVPWGHVISADVTTPIRPGSLGEPPPALAPALGLRCSLGDWASFAALHLAGARGATTTVLRPPSFGELQTPIDATHARGWYAVSRAWAGAALALNYTSRDPAEHAVAWLLPSKNVALLVATNQGGKAAENAADEIVLALVGAFAGAN